MHKRRIVSRVVEFVVLLFAIPVLSGCASTPPDEKLRERATLCLHRAMRFPGNPAVRAQGIEASVEVLGASIAPIVREGLRDEHPGVRFAACLSVGKLADRSAKDQVRALVADPDPNVRVGAFYALERMGDSSYRRAWVELMRDAETPAVRRNAVMALGLLEDRQAQPMLKRVASEDPDDGVRLQAVEGLAMLGDPDAEAGFIRDAFGGVGFRQPFALLALGRIKDPESISVLRSRLSNAPYLEARLAAARALAMQNRLEGFNLALQSLNWNKPDTSLQDDPAENQIMRVRTMAAMALGDMRDRRAVPALNQCMETTTDPRVQVAAARSILMIVEPGPDSQPADAFPPANR